MCKEREKVYVIDFGLTCKALTGTLESVKKLADNSIAYTQRDVEISEVDVPVDKFKEVSEKGNPMSLITKDNQKGVISRRWCAEDATEDEIEAYYGEASKEVIFFGKFGYYSPWEESLG